MAQSYAEVSFPVNTLRSITDIKSVDVVMRENAHTIAVVDTPLLSNLRVRTNDPALLALTFRGETLQIPGYVHHARPDLSDSKGNHGRLYLVGASFRFKNAHQRVWSDKTVSEVAAEIARANKITADIEPHTHRFDLIAQPGISDMAMLIRLAEMVGYVVYMTGTTLHFHSRARDQAAQLRSAPRLDYARDITEFMPILGENVPTAQGVKGKRTAWAVDPRTGATTVAKTPGTPGRALRAENPTGLFEVFDASLAATSPAEAAVLASGQDERARFQHRAKVICRGVQRIRPGSIIYFGSVPSDYDGYWTVINVTHRYEPSGYLMLLEVGTDSLGASSGQQPDSLPSALDTPEVDTIGSRLAGLSDDDLDSRTDEQRGGENGFAWVGLAQDVATADTSSPPPTSYAALRRSIHG